MEERDILKSLTQDAEDYLKRHWPYPISAAQPMGILYQGIQIIIRLLLFSILWRNYK